MVSSRSPSEYLFVLLFVCCCQSSEHTNIQDALTGFGMCLPINVDQHIIVDPLPNEYTNLSVQQIPLFICFIIRLYSGKYWFVKFFDIKQIFHFPFPNEMINTIQSNHSTCVGFIVLPKKILLSQIKVNLF